MAMEEKSIFEELAPYARMVVVPGVTVGNLTYSNQQDLYSTSIFSSSAAGIVAANTTVQFYVGALGEQAAQQGYAGGTLSLAQTNSTFSKGQAPANQVYIATHAGFLLSKMDVTTDLSLGTERETLLQASNLTAVAANKSDTFAVGQNFSWDLTIGRGITRTIGLLSEYTTPGAYGITDEGPTAAPLATVSVQNGSPYAGMVKLAVPIVFPPLVNVSISATNGSPFTLNATAAATNVQIKMILRGYLMTMPVG
jgi:hypothetical protein